MFSVLVVDDEPFVREGLKGLIDWEKCGFSICWEAGDGEEALRIIRRHNPDLVITDVKMPVMDGLELIRQSVPTLQAKSRFIILSGYNDFTYAKTAIKYNVKNYILKPVDEDELIETLVRIRQDIENSIKDEIEQANGLKVMVNDNIRRLLNGDMDPILLQHCEQWLDIREKSPLCYLLIELDDFVSWMDELEEEEIRDKLIFFKKTLVDAIGKINSLNIYEESTHRYGIIVNSGILGNYHGDIKSLGNILHRNLNDKNRSKISVYAGKPVDSPSRLRESYLAGLFAMERDFCSEGGTLVYFDELEAVSNKYSLNDDITAKELLNSISSYSVDDINMEVKDIFFRLNKSMYPPDVIKTIIVDFSLEILKLLSERNGDIEGLIGKVQDMHQQKMPMRRLLKTFTEFCLNCSMQIKALKDAQSTDLLYEMEKYIIINYKYDINLKSIAARFFINPIYLGQLFKKNHGIYFNDYLHNLRIEEAKRLLKQTDLKLYEISARIGYADSDYFIRKFKKITSLSPSQFRNQ